MCWSSPRLPTYGSCSQFRLERSVLQKIWILRKLSYEMDEIEAMEKLQKHLRDTKNNKEFFEAMTRAR